MSHSVEDQQDLNQAVHTIVDYYRARPQALIMALQDIQKCYNYLPMEALRLVAQEMTLPVSQIYSVATFYRSFSLTPKGKHHICVCTGTACHVRQAPVIVDTLSRNLGISPGETTADGEISFETVNCMGACALGPLVTVNGVYHGNMTAAKMNKLLDGLRGVERAGEDVEEIVEEAV